MDKDTLIKELTPIAESGDNNEILQWFVLLNKKYKKMKKDNQITDDIMVDLTEFLIELNVLYGQEFLSWLESEWGYDSPEFVKDIIAFSPKHREITYNRQLEKMDEFEKEEANLLFNAIWNKNMRAEIECDIFDWDTEQERLLSLTVPRKNREKYETELRKVCATTIYNRGSMYIRFFANRGQFEIVGIKAFNGTGEWSCFSEYELLDCFEEGLKPNEKVILLSHDHNNSMDTKDNVIMFRPKNRKYS
jgi:hypothetical protein